MTLTDQELEELKKKVWDRTKENIEKTVAELLISELKAHYYSELRKMIQAELRAILKPMFEAKRPEIEEKLRRLVNRAEAFATEKVGREILNLASSSGIPLLRKLHDIERDWTYAVHQKFIQELTKILEAEIDAEK
jgi:hypothetical protein